jgi:hypothetical protein
MIGKNGIKNIKIGLYDYKKNIDIDKKVNILFYLVFFLKMDKL